MIFSFLNIRKKTAATLSGVVIAFASLWGLAMWQDIPRSELIGILLASLAMLLVIVCCAIILIAVFKLLSRLLQKFLTRDSDN